MDLDLLSDKLETLILMALDANHRSTIPGALWKDRATGSVSELHDQGSLLRLDPMQAQSAYTFDATDHERLFTTRVEYLSAHPMEIIGEQAEVVMLDGDKFKWRGMRRMPRPPKGVACLGKAACWYEMHLRHVFPSGLGEYYQRAVALDRGGRPLLVTVQGHCVCSPALEGVSLILAASMIEDAHRADTMLASVKDATEIKFPVPLADYRELFAKRDGPITAAQRRKAIVHWVAQHLRRSVAGKEAPVRRHTRGIQEFVVDGLRIRLDPNPSTLRCRAPANG